MNTRVSLEWPQVPAVSTTLLATVGVVGFFIGLGTLTEQRWLLPLGMMVAALILGFHIFRRSRAAAARSAAQELLGARLIGRCHQQQGPATLAGFYEGGEGIVLVLTEDALYLCQNDGRLSAFASLRLYDIAAVESDGSQMRLTVAPDGLGEQQFLFDHFETTLPAERWASALKHASD